MGDKSPDHIKLQESIITDMPVFDDEFIAALMERIDMLKSGLAHNSLVIIAIAALLALAVIIQQIILSIVHGFI